MAGSSASTSYTDTGLAASTTYSNAVTAVNSVGESAKSAAVSATTTSGYAPTCYNASNHAHVQAGRAHDSGGYALADGSNQDMGLDKRGLSIAEAKEKLRVIVRRAVRLRCPRCGVGRIFESVLRYREHRACSACGFVYDPKGESLVFMYLSTAGLTGLVGLVMVLTQPESPILSRVLLVAGALALYLTTMPTRKALAIALNLLHERG